MTYALDSNTVSYLLRNEGNVLKNFKAEIAEKANQYAVPFMVVYEVKRWLQYKPTKILKTYNQEFDGLFQRVRYKAEMPLSVWEKATDIYVTLQSEGQLIGDADILIAAYCIVNGFTLVTRNASDFSRIDGLQFVDWFA